MNFVIDEKYDSYDIFDMTLDECKLVLDHIDGLIVVDAEGIIKYLSKDMLPRIESLEGVIPDTKVAGKYILDVHPISQICTPLTTGKTEDEHFYFAMGEINVAKIKPLLKEGEVVGAIDYDLFKSALDFKRFFDQLVKLSDAGYLDLSKTISHILENYNENKNQKYQVGDIIGTTPQMKQVKQKIHDFSALDATVLISGDTGCGKELVAHSIHNLSHRSMESFIEINCSAIPENLVESELFGYEEGTFTGAQKGGKKGKFELADRGTIFLDEIDQLPYMVQPKLLRALQEREISRIGGTTVPVDVRIIAATNKDLKTLIAEGKFRSDLYYRLNVLEIKLPSLSERKEDIPILAENFISQLNYKMGKNIKGLSDSAIQLLNSYSWPGNVRELQNVLERAVVGCNQETLSVENFREYFSEDYNGETNPSYEFLLHGSLEQVLAFAEKTAIEKALEHCEGNRSKAAEQLCITRPTLYYKMKKHNLVGDE
jgi:transcriptional regulator with PAS, ATPase and Fis domain